MALALFTLTLFRRGRIIHETTYFDNTGQQSPVHDVANILQYDSGMAFMAHSQCWPCKRPSWVAFSTARCTALSQTDACCQQTNLVRIIYRCPATAVTSDHIDYTISRYRSQIHPAYDICLLYTSPSPRDRTRSRMPSSA